MAKVPKHFIDSEGNLNGLGLAWIQLNGLIHPAHPGCDLIMDVLAGRDVSTSTSSAVDAYNSGDYESYFDGLDHPLDKEP